jgi:hypothetical protein
MSDKTKTAHERCERASDSLQRAASLLEQTANLRKSVARIRVSSKPTPSVILIKGVDGVLRVKKD